MLEPSLLSHKKVSPKKNLSFGTKYFVIPGGALSGHFLTNREDSILGLRGGGWLALFRNSGVREFALLSADPFKLKKGVLHFVCKFREIKG